MNIAEIRVKENKVGILKVGGINYISLTDLARYVDEEEPKIPIQNWMRNKDVISKIYSVVSKYVNQDILSGDEERLIKRGLDVKSLYSNLYPKKSLRSDREDFSSIGLK